MREKIFKIFDIVVKKNSDQMKVTYGGVIYDEWSRAGVYFLEISSMYMKEIKVQENNETITMN